MVIGKYIRLSLSDKDLAESKKTESESISHQRDLIQRYIDGHEDLKGCEVREFYDDGYSGTNFNRPAFERLMEQIRKGQIGCVVVKDFSRFGRNYIELGDYLERIFPLLGVRFISINDGYDSKDYKGTTGGVDVALKNIVYDYYSKDLSVKTSTAKTEKLKRGIYIGGHVPYGLMRDPEDHHKLAIDPEAGAVVREIFEAAINGKRIVDITRMLNEKDVETPAQYYQRKHPEGKRFEKTSEMACWNNCAVKYILKREMYYGAVTGHKRQSVGRGWKHSRKASEEEQIIVEGMHPGIVTKEEFQEAQKIFGEKAETKHVTDKSYPLWRKVCCGVCGRAMWTKWKRTKSGGHRYFYCVHAADQIGTGGCCRKWIKEDELNALVWESVKRLIDMVDVASEKVLKREADVVDEGIGLAKELAKLQREKEKCEAERFANVDGFMAGRIGKEEYLRKREKLKSRMELLEGKILEMEKRIREDEAAVDGEVREALDVLKKYKGEMGLTKKIVDTLVDKVVIYDPEHVEVRWKLVDKVVELLENERK